MSVQDPDIQAATRKFIRLQIRH